MTLTVSNAGTRGEQGGVDVLVVGSVNQDSYVRLARLPLPGETTVADALEEGLGGKGANQAVAASRAGASVMFLGAVGDDAAGREARALLEAQGVRTDFLAVREQTPTGRAFVMVEAEGQNSIIIHAGANGYLGAAAVAAAVDSLDDLAMVLSQGEVPVPTMIAAAESALRVNARFVLNLAPAVPVPERVIAYADPLIVNESEASFLLGGDELTSVDAAMAGARKLLALGSRSCVITLGEEGAVGADAEDVWYEPAPALAAPVIDTTGAGDALTGILTALLAQGIQLRSALQVATAGASLTVTRRGTISAYPDRHELDAIIESVSVGPYVARRDAGGGP